jgi:hypothetical protein
MVVSKNYWHLSVWRTTCTNLRVVLATWKILSRVVVHYRRLALSKKMIFLGYILYYFGGNFYLISSSIFICNSCYFQMKSNFFQHTYLCLNEKLVHMFFVRSRESSFLIVIEMVQSIHIQYIIKYFIKFCNYLNHLKNIFALCSIL